MIFNETLAEMMKTKAGDAYRPSNGFEGELFQEQQCLGCSHESNCDIVDRTMIFNRTDPEYPREWVIGDDGQPKCTAFEVAPNDEIISVYIVKTDDGYVAVDDEKEAGDLAREHDTTIIKEKRMLRSAFDAMPDCK